MDATYTGMSQGLGMLDHEEQTITKTLLTIQLHKQEVEDIVKRKSEAVGMQNLVQVTAVEDLTIENRFKMPRMILSLNAVQRQLIMECWPPYFEKLYYILRPNRRDRGFEYEVLKRLDFAFQKQFKNLTQLFPAVGLRVSEALWMFSSKYLIQNRN